MSNPFRNTEQIVPSRLNLIEQAAKRIMESTPKANPANLVHALDAQFINEFREQLNSNGIKWHN